MPFKKFYHLVTDTKHEEKKIIGMVASLALNANHKILDVGCGYGRNMILLKSLGLNVLGVDVNVSIVKSNIAKGLNCLSANDFAKHDEVYDLIIMSHVIEHFQPAALLDFMDSYLARLKNGGHLLIATTLMSPYFYDDFDHVKPYHPTGINMVFAKGDDQVQYYSKHTLELIDIWFRRSPLKNSLSYKLFLNKGLTFPVFFNFLSAIIFRLTCGLVGNKDGWVGVFRKVGE